MGKVDKLLHKGAHVLIKACESNTVFTTKCSNNIKQLLRSAAISELKVLARQQQVLSFDYDSIGFSDRQLWELAEGFVGCSAEALFEAFCSHCKNFAKTCGEESEGLLAQLLTSYVYELAGAELKCSKEVNRWKRQLLNVFSQPNTYMADFFLKYTLFNGQVYSYLAIAVDNLPLAASSYRVTLSRAYSFYDHSSHAPWFVRRSSVREDYFLPDSAASRLMNGAKPKTFS